MDQEKPGIGFPIILDPEFDEGLVFGFYPDLLDEVLNDSVISKLREGLELRLMNILADTMRFEPINQYLGGENLAFINVSLQISEFVANTRELSHQPLSRGDWFHI